jgi:predicted nucleotidyltransferase
MDSAALESGIREAASKPADVLAVYLFGSAYEGRMHKRSDVDVAVLFAEDTSPERALDVTFELASAIERSSGRPVQVTTLNRAHPSLAFRALRGRKLVDRDPIATALFAVRTISRYHAYRRFLRYHLPAVEARALEGRFGTAR